jgi:hypothetical protein
VIDERVKHLLRSDEIRADTSLPRPRNETDFRQTKSKGVPKEVRADKQRLK